MMRKRLRAFGWVLVALSALAFVVYRTPPTDFRRTISNLEWGWVILATIVFAAAQGLLAVRWQILLRVQGVHASLFTLVKLTYLGLFYNNLMPGAVGGDILKAWYITRHAQKGAGTKAATTVLVDRIIGLVGMVLVGGFASLWIGPEIAYGGIQIRWLVWGIFVAMTLGIAILLNRRLRRLLLIPQVAKKLPLAEVLRQVDDAIRAYHKHLLPVLHALSVNSVIQGVAILAVWMLTQGLRLEQVSFLQCVTLMPIVWLIGAAVPVPAGLGVVEGAIMYLFCLVIAPDMPSAAAGQAAALALLNRLMLCVSSLPGGLVPIMGAHLPKPEERTVAVGVSGDCPSRVGQGQSCEG